MKPSLTLSDGHRTVEAGADGWREKRRGRPATRVMPDPIPDTPENVVRALCQGPPKPASQWEFAKPGGAGYVREPDDS